MKPSITVITPVYNGARFIEACLENVASQQLPGLQHLVMDGASTDGTPERVAQWAAKYPHITLVSAKDNGQSDAMNKGIALAKAEVISFLNVDDYYEPDALPRAFEVIKKLPNPSFVCGNLNIWNADGTLKHFNRPGRVHITELVTHKFEWPYNPSAYFYHKALHDKVGLYNVDNHLCMDYEFILKVAAVTNIVHVDETWGNFVMVEGSKTLVSHTENPNLAGEKGKQLRQAAYELLSKEDKEKADALLKQTPVQQVAGNSGMVHRLRQNLKKLLRF